MSYLVYLTLLPPFLIGLLFSTLLLIQTRNINLLLLVSLGIPIGFGISSCLYFFWSYMFNPGQTGFIYFEFALIAALLFLIWRKKQFNLIIFTDFLKDRNKLHWILGFTALIVGGLGIASFVNYTHINPHGRYDAWAIWNVRARMLARAGVDWKSVFIPEVFHGDYPLLIPLTIARSWIMAGTESMRIPPAVAGLFTFSSAGILAGVLFMIKRWNLGWLAACVYLSTPWVLFFGSKQFSDLPLTALILAANACLFLALHDPENKTKWLVISAMAAGLAGWTKNEGQLFLLVYLIIAIAILVFFHDKKNTIANLKAIGLGVIIPAIVIVLFKIDLAPPNDLLNSDRISTNLNNLISFDRYGDALRGMFRVIRAFGGGYAGFPLILLIISLLSLPVIMKIKIPGLTLGLILVFQLVGYFFIYIITPLPMLLHINQSFDRLLMHLYPSFLLLVFSIIWPIEVNTAASFDGTSPPAV